MFENRKKFSLLVFALLITGFLATSLVGYFVSRSSLREQIIRHELPLTSDNIYSEIQRDILRPIFISSLMASDTFLRDWVLDGEADPEQMARYLREIQTEYGTFTSFFVSENTATYYHPSGILKKVQPDEPRDQWFYRMRQLQEPYEINIDADMAHKDAMTIFVNYRVLDYEGNFIGATGVGLQVTAVKTLIRKYQDSYGRKIFFIDAQGEIRLSPNAGEHSDEGTQVPELLPFLPQMKSTKSLNFRFRNERGTIHANTRYIPEFDWYLIVEQQEGLVTAGIRNALLFNLGICAIITCIVLVLTSLIFSRFQRRLEKMATTDKLTGLYNRQAYDILFEQAIRNCRRENSPLSIALFDIDLFKQVNDQFGHLAGDRVIAQIAKTAKTVSRQNDVIFRWGGEEFLVLLKDCPLDGAQRSAEALRKTIEESEFNTGDQSVRLTVSVGVTQWRSQDSENTLIKRADDALYRAKREGRNQTQVSEG